MNTKTNTRTLALIIIFVALAVAINAYGPKVPFPPAPFLFFQLWEIPIVIAFLAIGVKPGIAVAVINSLVLVFVFSGRPSNGPTIQPHCGTGNANRYIPTIQNSNPKSQAETLSGYSHHHIAAIAIAATAFGMATRILITTVVNYFALHTTLPNRLSGFPKSTH